MFEYKILQVERAEIPKDVVDKKGRILRTIALETIKEFCVRVEKVLNFWAQDGWQVINTNYSLPIQSEGQQFFTGLISITATDFNKAEFVFVLQREK